MGLIDGARGFWFSCQIHHNLSFQHIYIYIYMEREREREREREGERERIFLYKTDVIETSNLFLHTLTTKKEMQPLSS